MNRIVLAALALALAPTAAAAKEGGDAFDGAFAGIEAGWGERSADIEIGIPGLSDLNQGRSSFDFGGFVGYDMTTGSSFVVGLEAGIGAGGATLEAAPAADLGVSIDPKWNYALSARAGVLATPDLLIYGRAGYGGERLTTRVTTIAGVTSESGWSEGVILGGGLEYALAGKTRLRAEYRHRDMEGGYAADQVLAGVSFRF